jgi:hypothetical protein
MTKREIMHSMCYDMMNIMQTYTCARNMNLGLVDEKVFKKLKAAHDALLKQFTKTKD